MNNCLKQFYLKLFATGSLSSMVTVLVRDFIKDQELTYIRGNYTASQQYRTYDASIPSWLTNRPRSVVVHCLKRMNAAKMISADDIQELSDGLFIVKSQTKDSAPYRVSFGNDSQSPYCECQDFVKNYLPCKHFLAVFTHTDYNWNSLAEAYKNSPYVNLDNDVLSVQDGEEPSNPAEQIEDNANAQSEVTSENASFPADHPGSPPEDDPDDTSGQTALTAPRRRLRELLKRVEDASFLCNNATILAGVTDTLRTLETTLRCSAEKSEGLSLHMDPQVASKVPARPLPRRRRKKRPLHLQQVYRVGAKARRIKKHTIYSLAQGRPRNIEHRTAFII